MFLVARVPQSLAIARIPMKENFVKFDRCCYTYMRFSVCIACEFQWNDQSKTENNFERNYVLQKYACII